MRHLRAIARSPRHLSHETNVELYELLGIKECGQALLDLMSNRVASLERRKTPCHGTVDILNWQKEKLQQLQEHFTSQSSQEVDNTLGTEVQCRQCQILVSNLSALKTHFAVKHGQPDCR